MAVFNSDVTYLFECLVVIKVKTPRTHHGDFQGNRQYLISALCGAEYSVGIHGNFAPRGKCMAHSPSVSFEKAAGWTLTAGLDVLKK